ncbi:MULTISPECIES: LrgB family protein [Sediminibacillus]|uniref:LrgB family protein n=1 Tax=Sediminibacillus TaxID=482460 RepID=UPI0003F66A29|nr:LrgB family protein [Sediminibacillus terrae]
MSIIFFIFVTSLLYMLAKAGYKRIPLPIFHPLLLSPILIIVLISLLHVSADQYLDSASLLTHMLGPATVAFAIPIYKHLPVLKKYIGTIVTSITIGTLVAIFSSFLLSLLMHLNNQFLVSVLPRSITTPIAIEVSKDIGGIPTLTTVFVILTGIIGGIIGPAVIKRFSIKSTIAKGLALGTSAHGVGTNKAMEYGEQAATFSTLAMIFAASLTVLWGKFLIPMLVSFIG